MSKNTNISELINYISYDGSGNIVFTTVSAATTNTDKFLVSDAGTLKYRTAAQLLSDIGAQASGSYQAALSGTGFVKISGTTISYDNSTYATQTYVGTAISNLVDSSPATLDTLNELAAALGDDPNFATTVATSIGTKQPQLNGTGFVVASGTAITYDNSIYSLDSGVVHLAGTETITGVKSFDQGVNIKHGIFPLTLGYTGIGAQSGGLIINVTGGGYGVGHQLLFSTVNPPYTYTFPNATGTIALTSDLPMLSGFYVPYTGASSPVDLGTNDLASKNLTAGGGVAIGGVLNLKQDAIYFVKGVGYSSIASGLSSFNFYGYTGASTSKRFRLRFDSLTDNTLRSYTLPDADGTLALTSNIPTVSGVYLPLAGGTLTGALGGTTATFSGVITGQSNANTFGNASASGRAVIIQSGSTNQAIMFKNAAGGDGTLFINGTSTSVDYNFNTYSVADALVIKNNGRVGIGLANPQSQLHINGVLTFTESGYDTERLHTISHAHSAGSNPNNYIAFNVSNGFNSTSERVRITGDGYVGIGSNNPTHNLEIKNSAGSVYQKMNADFGIGYFGMETADDSMRFVTAQVTPIQFYTDNTERMRITAGAGNDLVIGHIGGNPYTAGNRGSIFLNGSSTSLYAWGTGGTARGYMYHNGSNIYLENSVSAGSFNILQVGNGNINFSTNSLTRLSIQSNGAVVIGRQFGNQYSQTSSTGTTSIVDTGITYDTGDYGGYSRGATYQVVFAGNPNAGGSGAYYAQYMGIIMIYTGWSGSNVTTYIQYTQLSGGNNIGALTLTPHFWNGTSEVSSINVYTGGYQIRLKISGYNSSYVGSDQSVYLTRLT
jgi:hypothetical protein